MAAEGKNPTGVVVAAGVIVAGSTVVRDVHEGQIRAAPIVFGFLMVSALLLIGMASPKTARGLAYLSMIGALAVNGPAVFSIVSGLSEAGKPATTPPAGTATAGSTGGGTNPHRRHG